MKSLVKILFIFLFLFEENSVLSQSLIIDWQKCYGGTEVDGGSGLIKIPLGYILFGDTYSADGIFPNTYGNGDFFLIWTDSLGNLTSVKTFGGTNLDDASDIIAAPTGGYVMFGSTFSNNFDVYGNHGSGDLWVVKVNDTGSIQWQRCLGGSWIEQEGMNIEIMPDSGFICAGATASNDGDVTGFHGFYDYWPVKIDKSGSLGWENCYGGTMVDWCHFVTQTKDGGMVMAGSTDTPDGDVQCNYHGGSGDAWIVKLDSSGNIEWQNCYGGSGMDNLSFIMETTDGEYLCAGTSNSNDGQVAGNHGGYDFWVLKLDQAGTVIWQKCFGGSADEGVDEVMFTSEGNYLIAGYTYSNDGNVSGNHSADGFQDIWLVKVSPIGQLIWEQCIGGDANEGIGNLIEYPDGEYTIIGFTSSTSNSGDVNCSYHGGIADVWLVHVHDTTLVDIPAFNNLTPIVQIYPNPASSFIIMNYDFPPTTNSLMMTLINGTGQPIGLYYFKRNKGQITIDLTDFSPGLYCYILNNSTISIKGEFIIVK